MKNKSNQIAIVTDGLWRKSLSAVRSLGKAGYDVWVMGDSYATSSFWSRYAKGRIVSPTAQENKDAFLANLIKLLQKFEEKPVLLPMEDATLLCVSEARKELAGYADFLIPDQNSLLCAEDKASTIKMAQEIGISCPKTWFPENVDTFLEIIRDLPSAEYLVKPCSGSGSAGLVYGLNKTAGEWVRHWESFGNLIIQERIPAAGQGKGVGLLFDSTRKVVASFAHKRLRQYPNSGGPSTDRQAIFDSDLIKESQRLLDALHWQGIGMVEWKVDVRDGRPKLMEINPRFWGSLELAVRAGVDFPVLYAKLAKQLDVNPILSYNTETRCRWLIPGDILRYVSAPKRERESFLTFLSGLPAIAEEWDRTDLQGFISTLFCTFIAGCNPKYWKYVRR